MDTLISSTNKTHRYELTEILLKLAFSNIAPSKLYLNIYAYQLSFKGELYTIHPVLSTGTKIWHLRDESKFYPKINFNNAIKVIPSKAVVILCFGEIDCREAFLMCVEKAKYEVSMILVIDLKCLLNGRIFERLFNFLS